MANKTRFSMSRRYTLAGLLSFPLAVKAWADEKVSLPAKGCKNPKERVTNTLYEFDLKGKAVEWDYPSGKPTRNGLTLKGLGVQKTNSVKNTSSGFTDKSELADRFVNLGDRLDWHPTNAWTVKFTTNSAAALIEDNDIVSATSISDNYFAFQRVGGLNPSMLKKVENDYSFSGLMKPGGDYYMVDYESLGTLEDNDHVSSNPGHKPEHYQRYGYQPKALFVAEGGKLKPTAIQIRRGKNVAMVKPGETKWEIAKFILQNADFNYHQLAAHLGRTHLYIEAIAVSTGICLPKDIHPLSRLLRPHMEGTINITDFATTDLINISPQSNNGGIFNQNFTGTMGSNLHFIKQEVFGLYSASELKANPALAKRSANLFNASMFPNDIVRRGVGHVRTEKIQTGGKSSKPIDIMVHHAYPEPKLGNGVGFEYPYLEDSCKIWNAITDWVCRYISAYYKSDLDVQNDCELQNWASTVVKDGKILGFGEYQNGSTLEGQILTRAYLVQALSAIIFTTSAQHAAVNFPQAEYGPTNPAGIYHDFFEGGSDDLSDYLPSAIHFKEVMELWSVLSSTQYTTLGKYHDNSSSGKELRSIVDYFDRDDVEDYRKQFRKELKALDAQIKKREKAKKSFPYEFLRPSNIPQSVNV